MSTRAERRRQERRRAKAERLGIRLASRAAVSHSLDDVIPMIRSTLRDLGRETLEVRHSGFALEAFGADELLASIGVTGVQPLELAWPRLETLGYDTSEYRDRVDDADTVESTVIIVSCQIRTSRRNG